MAAHSPLRGAEVVLPQPCAGALLPDVDLRCPNAAEVACWGLVLSAEGEEVMALVAVCRHHVRSAVRWMKAVSLLPDDIETWRLETFLEHEGVFARHGVEVFQLRATA